MAEATVAVLVDYESPLARRVAGEVWSGLSRAALNAGYVRTTARWGSIRESRSREDHENLLACVLVMEQGLPEAVEAVGQDAGGVPLYGMVVAVPEQPSPLASSLLYQAVERLTESGVKAGAVEPALLRAAPEECERYARRLLEHIKVS